MLSTVTGNAIRALVCLASKPGGFVTVKEVADCTGLPHPFLSKIALSLSRKGLVHTQKGIGGGVGLACDPETTSLYEVCVAMDELVSLGRCFLGSTICSEERNCPYHDYFREVREGVLHFLKTTTIADVARFEAIRCGAEEPGDARADRALK